MPHGPEERKRQLARSKAETFLEIGKSGVFVAQGIISLEEYNRDLRGRSGLKIYNEMRKSDGTVRASLQAVKLPVMGAEWTVESADDTPEAEFAQRIVESSLMETMSWHDTLRQVLTYLDFGFSLFEHVYEVGRVDGKEAVVLSKLGFRKQESIFKWEMENPKGEPGITQTLPDGGKASIPWVKLSLFNNDREGDNYEGVSLLRAAYQHWYIKSKLYQIDAVANEKQGLGIIKIKTPSEASESDKADAREVAREQRANEEAFIEEPEGYDIEFMDMKARTTRDIMPSIQHHDRQIMKNVLAQFLEIGSQGSQGSFSASQDQSPLFIMSLEAAARNVASVLKETVIKNLMILNGVRPELAPELKFSKIGKESISVFAEAVTKLVTAGVVTPDPEIEEAMRAILHLPAMPDDMAENFDEVRKTRNAAKPEMTPTEASEIKGRIDSLLGAEDGFGDED